MNKTENHQNSQPESYSVYFDAKNVITNFKSPIYQWHGHLPEGCFTLPFTFKLPDNLPGSFNYIKLATCGNIQYFIKAKLVLADKKRLKDKTEIFLNQKNHNSNFPVEFNSRIRTGCCFNRRMCFQKFKFSQDAFTPDQVVNALVETDNSNSKLDLENVVWTL